MVRDRIRFLIAILILPFLVVVGKLAAVQLFQGSDDEEEMSRSEVRRRRRIVLLPPTRGSILDRHGAVLARDDASFSLEFNLQDLHPRERYLPVVERALELCDDRCSSEEPAGKGANCQGLVLEEHLQAVLGTVVPGADGLRPQGPDAPDPVLVEDIPSSLRSRLDQKLHRGGGLVSLERNTGMYFLRAEGGDRWELRVRPAEAMAMEETLRRLSLLIGEPVSSLRRVVEAARAEAAAARNPTEKLARRQRQRVLAQGVSDRAVTEIVYQPELFPGIRVVDGHRRVYPRAESCSSLTGFLRSPGDREMAEGLILESYPLDDIDFVISSPFSLLRQLGSCAEEGQVGARGLEEYYDSWLRGIYGVRVEEIDARHVSRKPLLDDPPRRGRDLRISLDAELQELIYRELEPFCLPRGEALAGAAAVMDLTGRYAPDGAGPPGALLAACGFPGYDPNRIRSAAYQEEVKQRELQFHQGIYFNRVARGRSPPGSVFKLVVAAAAMESGMEWPVNGGRPVSSPLLPGTRFPCTHLLDPSNPRGLRCLSRNGHGQPEGMVDLVQALQYSCNIYFYRLGRERLQPALLWAWARELGFGRNPGIDLDDPAADLEAPSGILRRDERKIGRDGMLQYAIGQVFVEGSVLQVLRMTAAIALDGRQVPWPWLATPRPPEPLKMSPSTTRVLKEGMTRVIQSPGGTAAEEKYGLGGYLAAAKTGTAELREGDPEAVDPQLRPLNYAWIAGYAPLERPEIAFVVLLERTSLHGADCARVLAPILEHFAREAPDRFRRPSRAAARTSPRASAGSEGPR